MRIVMRPLVTSSQSRMEDLFCLAEYNATHSRNGFITKVSSSGGIEWTKHLNYYYAGSIMPCSNGGFYTSGYKSHGFFGEDHIISKFNIDGEMEWCEYVGEQVNWYENVWLKLGFERSENHEIFLLYDWKSLIPDYRNSTSFVKLSSTGGAARRFSNHKGVELIPRNDGDYFCVSIYLGQEGASQKCLSVARIDENKTIEWQCHYHSSNEHLDVVAAELTPDGGLWVVGDNDKPFVLKLSPDGSIEWQNTFDRGKINAVTLSPDGSCVCAGNLDGNIWIMMMNTDGTIAWQYQYGGEASDNAKAVCIAQDGGYAVLGDTRSFGEGGADLFLLKVGSDGRMIPDCGLLGFSDNQITGQPGFEADYIDANVYGWDVSVKEADSGNATKLPLLGSPFDLSPETGYFFEAGIPVFWSQSEWCLFQGA